MKIPIPDDWNGEDWTCVRIEWPNSPIWIALLTGFLSLPSYGYYWDERSGIIRDVQAIGRELFDRNFPYNDCADCDDKPPAVEPDKVFVGEVVSEFERILAMSLCGYNPKAFKIEGGNLYVRDFCGDWVLIGALSGGGEVLPDDPPIDPPPGGIGSGTACSKAQKMSVLLANVINVAFNVGDLDADFVWGWYDFADNVRNAFANINFGDVDLYNLYYYIVALETAGLENETESDDIRQSLACAWEPLLTDGDAGISSTEYEQMKTTLSNVLRNVVGDSAHSGFGQTMRYAWERAFSSIGANDVKKITTGLISTGLEDCSCPDLTPDTTPPVTGDWYLGAPINLGQFSADDDRYNSPEGTFNHCWTAEHGVYGVAVEYVVVNAVPMKDFSLGAGVDCGWDAELTEYNGTMDYTASSIVIFEFDNAISALLYAAWGTSRGVAYREDRGNWSSVVNTPVVEQGQTAGVSGTALADPGQTVFYTVTVYPIKNAGDDSHA